MTLRIVPLEEGHVPSLRECLDVVARENRYLALLEAPPLEASRAFLLGMKARGAIQLVALEGERVVGWVDIAPFELPTYAHRGKLGMGVLPEHRGQGLGKRLFQACLDAAWAKGLTRIELEVRADNLRAKRLYERFGFRDEGVLRNAMRFEGQYFDCFTMSLLKP